MEQERLTHTRKIRELMEHHQTELKSSHGKWQAELQEERSRISELQYRGTSSVNEQVKDLQDRLRTIAASHRAEVVQLTDQLTSQHKEEMKEQEHKWGQVVDSIREEERKRAQAQTEAEVERIGAELRQQRDKELKEIVQKLSAETVGKHKQLETSVQGRVAEVTAHYEGVLGGLREKVEDLTQQLQEAKGEVQGYKEALEQAEFVQHETLAQYEQLKESFTALQTELSASDIRRSVQFKSGLAAELSKHEELSKDYAKVQGELAELTAEHESALELLKAEQEYEIDSLEMRVRDAIAAKDGLIEELQEALELEQVKTKKLGELLEVQRAELLRP
jgi:phage host-nuclease inhibitor protein Gam